MSSEPSSDPLIEAALACNPFARNRISDPSQMDCDVSSIHASQFARLTELAEECLRGNMARGVLLLGSAGTGKSHLLARLSRWAANRQACFVFLHNIQVRPNDMGRYLLKCSINRLAEDRLEKLHDTLLFRVVWDAIWKAAVAEGISVVGDRNYQEVYTRLSRRLGGDEDIFSVIFQFFFHAAKFVKSRQATKRADHARLAALAVRWLKGDVLDADEAQRLGQRLRPHEEVLELGEHQVESVLRNIARLARESDRPFILCVDQADNMKEDQLSALCKSLHSLIDAGQNLLVVLSGVREDILELIHTGVIHAAAADRLDHTRPIVLHRIKRPEARLLLRERLASFFGRGDEPSPMGEHYRTGDDLFPLGSYWFEQMEAQSLELRPRDVLTWASDRWREFQDWIRVNDIAGWPQEKPAAAASPTEWSAGQLETAIDHKVADKLDEAVSARRLQPALLPADAGNLLGLTTELLQQCVGRGRDYSLVKVDPQAKRMADLIVHERIGNASVQDHIVFVVTGSKQRATVQLRKLLNSPGADHRILVTDEDRAPLLVGPKGEEYLAELQQLGPRVFTHVKLKFEHYAQLDALMSVVGQARSGDLEIEPVPGQVVPVTEDQVIDSYHRHDRYRQHVLLQIFLCEERAEPTPRPPFPPRQEFREFVLGKLSFLMGANMIELIRGFVAEHAPDSPAWETCLPAAKEIVLEMHAEELVSAKPWDNDLYLTIGRKA